MHVNACKPFVEMLVHRAAVWAIEDELLEQQTRLLGKELSQGRKKELEEVAGKWARVLTDEPGRTELLRHDINTGDAPPMRALLKIPIIYFWWLKL